VDSSRPTPGISDLEWFLRKIQRLDATEGRIVDFLRRNQGDVKSVVEDPFLVEAYWKWNGELTNDRKKKDLRAVTESTHRRDLGLCLRIVFAWRLRTLRNLLVHGASTNRYSKRRETEDGQLSLAASTRLIERGVACFLAVMEDGDQKRWPPTEAPRAGSPLHGLRYDWPEPVAEEWELLRRTFRS
jgi:hypothetical protein